LTTIACANFLDPKQFEKQYKDHLSEFRGWEQLPHAEDWILFPENLGPRLSIDETSLSNGELYTIVTNKDAKGKKGSIVAIIKGTKGSVVSNVLCRISYKTRLEVVTECTIDLANNMYWIVRECFPHACIIHDRFHVQQLVSEALQEIRIKLRWKAIDKENKAVAEAKKKNLKYKASEYSNGDTEKQLLARSRYLLFKPKSKWKNNQKERAAILFKEFPELEEAYKLSMMFRSFYETSKNKENAQKKLDAWYAKVDKKKERFPSFVTASKSIKAHENSILTYFFDRSTNAAAESFNAKIKGFRALLRGVRDKKFFLFRLSKIYA
jgi:transposase